MSINWFISRTGHAYGNSSLSDRGRKQIEKLNNVLTNYLNVNSGNSVIFYTPSIRGEETAKILGKRVKRISINELWTDSDKPKGNVSSVVSAHSKILNIDIEARNYILITDYDSTSEYPKYLSNRILNRPLEFSPLLPGECYWLSTSLEEWKKLPSDERMYYSKRIMVKG